MSTAEIAGIETDFVFHSERRHYLTAWRALRTLIKNQDDTRQVFTIMESLAGNSGPKQFLKFIRTETGRKVLSERLELVELLRDHEKLRAMPEGSLGRAYLHFVERENLSPDELIELSQTRLQEIPSRDLRLFYERTREIHDIWHVLTGYGRDGLGEVCLVAFSYAQTTQLGYAAIALMGSVEFKSRFPDQGVWSAVWEAYRHGKKAEWLPGLMYEEAMAEPLDDLRARLGIKVPEKYLALPDVIEGTASPAALAGSENPA